MFQIRGRKRSTTWDGTVADKTIKKKTKYQEDANEDYLEYSVIIRSDQGKKHVIQTKNSDMLYNYFNIGNRVRHHAGLKSLKNSIRPATNLTPATPAARFAT